jgi:hypothetical protein
MGFSHARGWAQSAENLGTSPFKSGPSIDTTFSHINLVGYPLYSWLPPLLILIELVDNQIGERICIREIRFSVPDRVKDTPCTLHRCPLAAKTAYSGIQLLWQGFSYSQTSPAGSFAQSFIHSALIHPHIRAFPFKTGMESELLAYPKTAACLVFMHRYLNIAELTNFLLVT